MQTVPSFCSSAPPIAPGSIQAVHNGRVPLPQGLDFFGGRPLREEEAQRAAEWEREDGDARIVIMADLWLDRPDTLPKLQRILDGARRVSLCDRSCRLQSACRWACLNEGPV